MTTPDKQLADYRASAAMERDKAALERTARDHHLAEATEARYRMERAQRVGRGDVAADEERVLDHHRRAAAQLAAALRETERRVRWYDQAIRALKDGRTPPPFSTFGPNRQAVA